MRLRHASVASCAALLLTAPAAFAGKPGTWTKVGQSNLDNIDEVALSRTGDGTLHAVWTIPSHNDGGGGDSLVHAAIAPNGTAGAADPIASGWATITAVPELVTLADGSLRVFFGGIKTTNADEPNSNMNTATAPAAGTPWNVFTGTTVTGDAAYGGDDGAAVLPDGTPLVSFGGTGSGTFVHRGLDPAQPNTSVQAQFGGCCGYSPDIAVDTASGVPVIAWYSNATDHLGLFAQSLDPGSGATTGAPTLMPGSTTVFNSAPNSSQQLSRTPIAARVGGGVYIAYSGGYPTTTKALLWRVGAPSSLTLDQSNGDHIVGLAADPDGRLWAFWISRGGSTPVVFARRSNKAATAFGPTVAAKAPAGQQSGYKISGNAQSATLDLVGLFGDASSTAQWHTQVLPALAIRASPSTVKNTKSTKVKFTVSDPDPVKGATVKALGKSATTDAKGQASIVLGPTSKSSIAVTVAKAGYTGGKAKVKVKHG
jgi:phosphotransferase system IIB component